jgi:RNA polymerase primary sigma factor
MTHDVDNPVQVYLREVAKVSLLTPAAEKQLIARVREGGEDSEVAKKDLVEAHLGQVVSIAQEYTQASGRLLDLIQAGNLGLLKAANELDGSSNAPFSAHAARYIRQAIAEAPPVDLELI